MDKTKLRKHELTKESILHAISKGDKSLTQIAHRHGHIGSVSSTVTAKVRKLVPDIAERMLGKVTAVVTPVAPVKPAVSVPQHKGVYRGMYGIAFDKAVKAGEVSVREFIPKAAAEIASDPACAAEVAKLKAKIGDADLVAAISHSIWFAIGVIRHPNHQSNQGKSTNLSEKRGYVRIVAVEG